MILSPQPTNYKYYLKNISIDKDKNGLKYYGDDLGLKFIKLQGLRLLRYIHRKYT